MAHATPFRILFVEDLPSDAELAEREIRKSGLEFTPRTVDTKDAFLSALEEFQPDVIVSDYKMPEFDGMEALKLSLERDATIPFIVLTGSMNEETAVECMKAGATNYVIKEHIARLPFAIREALEQKEVRIARDDAERALKISEERLRVLFESAPDGVFLADLAGTFADGNRAAEEIVGYKREELIGKSIFSLHLIARADIGKATALLAKNAIGKVYGPVEFTLCRKDGSRIAVEVRTYPVKIGDRTQVLGIARDITERKRVQEALSESERRFHQLFDEAPVGYHELDIQGRIVEVNRTELEMLGYTAEEMLHHPVWEFIVERESSREAIAAKIEGSMRSDLAYERTFRRRDGTVLNVFVSDRPLRNEAGQITGIRSTVQDITERKRAEEVVRESEERFRMVFEHVFDGISIYSEDPVPTRRRLIDCNERYAAMAGRSREELLTLGSTQELQVTLEETANSKRLESLTREAAYQGSFSWIRPDGKENIVEYIGMPIMWQGKSYSIGIDRDITERKKAERELRLMAQTIESARDCISIADLQNRLLFVNDAFRNTYGYTTEELLGKDVSILRSPNSPPTVTDPILHETLGGGWHGEILNRRKDGSDFPVELWTSVVKDEAGTPVALVGVARNITDRKVAEEHVKQGEEQFRLIAENVADMIAVVGLDGKRIYNSPSYKNILGDPESLKGTEALLEIHPEDRERVKRVFQETVRTGVGQRIEYRLLGPDGSVSNIDSKGSVIRDGDGKISRVIVVSRDVTEEKRLAAQFLRAQRMESIGTLAGGIAHDLNNVLAPIMMAIEVLRSKVPDQGGQKILSTIETSARRGADIVRQVLAFGRGVEGDRILVQIKHVVNEVAKIAGETFPKSIDIKTDIPRDLWTVSADPTQMHQVLLNILVNARDAMPKGGTLSISAENTTLDETYSRMHPEAKPGAYVALAIADTGTGIHADIREKIFEPFFTTKEVGMGTGLGLSTTLAIVRSHKGFINVYSELGKGTTFRVYIPATGAASRVVATGEDADLHTGNGELILIIDDEAAIREITKETLQAYGYKAMTAGNGAEGVAVYAENKKNIKVVITDIMMPVMDGTAAILALKRINPDVKIIAASGLTTKGQITTPSDPNVQAFLTKPYTAEKLLEALAAVLQ
jgi:PAS domain S-box-containing protein